MQILNPLRPYAADIDAFARSLKLWVLELAMWVAALTGSREGRIELRKWLAQTRREIRELILLRACQRLLSRADARYRVFRPVFHFALNRRRGFRMLKRRIRHIRFLARGVRLRTLRDMQRVLANIDRVVARVLKRMPRAFARYMLIAVAPPVQMCAPRARAPAPDGADTS